MSVTQIPPRDPPVPPPAPDRRDLSDAQHWETAYRRFNPDAVPHLLVQLQDDLSRARKREAVWLSVVLHLLVVILLVKISQYSSSLVVTAPSDLDKQLNATYLELPPDEQKATRRPDSKIISDKDRIASSKAPQINREDLKKLAQSAHPGQPGPTNPLPPSPAPEMAQNQAQRQSAPPQESQPPNQNSGITAPADNQTARLQLPAKGTPRQPSFSTPTTAGSAIEQATRAAAANRGYYGGGDSGDYGLSRGKGGAKVLDQAEILTDTMGVDFGPYLARVLQEVKVNWYLLVPESAMPPIMKQGMVSIEFVILKDGKVAYMQWHSTSGDRALDTAAWGGIVHSNPFPPLPKEFQGPNLGLRINFFYNPDKGEIIQ